MRNSAMDTPVYPCHPPLVIRSASLLSNLLLERPNVSLYPLHSALQRVDVLGEQLVADTVLVDYVVVHTRAGGRGTKEETEQSASK